MRMILTLILWSFAAVVFCQAQESSLKVIIPFEEQDSKEKIQLDNNHVRIEKPLPGKKRAKPLPGSLAERIGEPDMEIIWTPAWDGASSGGSRLKNAAIARDKTVLFCIEETGTPGKGPFGSALFLVDPIGKQILRFYGVGRRITAISPDIQGTKAVCFAEKQTALKQPAGFLALDLKTGKELAFYPMEEAPSSFLLYKDNLFSTFPDSAGLERMNLKTGERKNVPGGLSAKLELTGDSRFLVAVSNDAVRFYDPETLDLLDTVPLPPGTSVYRVVPGDANGSTLFISTVSGNRGKSRILLVYKQSVKVVTEDSSGEIAYNPKDVMLFSGRFLKNRLYKIDPVVFSDITYCDPKNLRPITGGSTRFLFCGPGEGELLVIDSRGAVYTIKNIRRRWIKSMIVESGMRSN